MIELSLIQMIIMQYSPIIVAIIGCITTCIKSSSNTKKILNPIITEFTTLKEDVKAQVEMNELKIRLDEQAVRLEALAIENRQLKKEMADLITVLRKQQYEIPKN